MLKTIKWIEERLMETGYLNSKLNKGNLCGLLLDQKKIISFSECTFSYTGIVNTGMDGEIKNLI